GDGGGPDELPVTFAAGAELTDVLLVERDDRDMYPIRPIFIGPVQDIHHLMGAQGQVHRVPEPRPRKLIAANGVAVGEGPVLYPKKMCTHRFSPVVTVCIGPCSLPTSQGGGRVLQPAWRPSPPNRLTGRGRSRPPSALMQESHPLKVPTDDGLRRQAQPILQDGGVDGTEVHVVLQIAALFLLTRLQGGVFAVETTLDVLTNREGHA